MDCHLILGGYDEAKATGPNTTRKLLPSSASCPCGMLMTVTTMILGFPNGTRADMLAPSTLSACIQPDYPVIISSRFDPFFQRFLDLTRTSHDDDDGSEPWAMPAWRLDGMYPGDVTLVSDSQMRLNLPNDMLILPEESVASDGSFETNASAPGILLAPTVTVNVNDVPLLGRPSFTAAYLMVDLDAQTWTIWQANTMTDSRLVPAGETCSKEDYPQYGSNTNPSGSESDGGAAAANRPRSEGGLSTGAIAVGAVAGCLLATLLCSVFIRRRRLARRSFDQSSAASSPSDHLRNRAHAYGQGGYIDSSRPQEVSASSEVHEVDPKHLLAEAPGRWRRKAVELPSSR